MGGQIIKGEVWHSLERSMVTELMPFKKNQFNRGCVTMCGTDVISEDTELTVSPCCFSLCTFSRPHTKLFLQPAYIV